MAGQFVNAQTVINAEIADWEAMAESAKQRALSASGNASIKARSDWAECKAVVRKLRSGAVSAHDICAGTW